MKRPSYASVVSTLARFVALGGTAGAATYVVSSSKQIKNGAIRNAEVRKGTSRVRSSPGSTDRLTKCPSGRGYLRPRYGDCAAGSDPATARTHPSTLWSEAVLRD